MWAQRESPFNASADNQGELLENCLPAPFWVVLELVGKVTFGK